MIIRSRADSLVTFFFQAEDGIRDTSVTGVQTCALPISCLSAQHASRKAARRSRRRIPDRVRLLLGLIWQAQSDSRSRAKPAAPLPELAPSARRHTNWK